MIVETCLILNILYLLRLAFCMILGGKNFLILGEFHEKNDFKGSLL